MYVCMIMYVCMYASIYIYNMYLSVYPQVGPWPAVGRKPLNPAMLAADPQKIIHSGGVFTFFRIRGGTKRRCN